MCPPSHDSDKACRSEHNQIILPSKFNRQQPPQRVKSQPKFKSTGTGGVGTAPWQVIAALLAGGVASEPAPFLNQPRHTSRTYGARAPRQIRHPVISRAPPIALPLCPARSRQRQTRTMPGTCPADQPHLVFFNTTLSEEIRLKHRAIAGRRRRGDGGDDEDGQCTMRGKSAWRGKSTMMVALFVNC